LSRSAFVAFESSRSSLAIDADFNLETMLSQSAQKKGLLKEPPQTQAGQKENRLSPYSFLFGKLGTHLLNVISRTPDSQKD